MTRAFIPRERFGSARWERNARRELARSIGIARANCASLFSDISIPNSICFSPDGRIAYFADTGKNIIWRVDTDPETGLPIGEPALFYQHKEKGGVDGSVVDARRKFVERLLGRIVH